MSKRGLPTGIRMRHDAHYVEELATHHPTPIGRLIALDQLDPNPEQPRVEIGDLNDLTASIKEKGVLEPLLVKPSRITGRWMIIAGERRWRASKAAGLREVPCIEMEVDDRAVAEIALIENMQRKDLTAWEEADGLAALCERFGYTHEDVARKVGKSRSTVTEALSIASLPKVIREKCRRADIGAKSLLLQVVRQPHIEAMHDILDEITTQGLNRDGARAARRSKQEGKKPETDTLKPRPYIFKYAAEDGEFAMEIRFKSSEANSRLLADALHKVLASLKSR
ncbi:MAG: ParB family transcriptional regulator, chromosome partitioning protein [Pyrinomonadaceae bacterium]|nr:ParB family transcriptional regulator, chromosome partitioning protein [Pyrinomonadaceae bacterium]